jgi:hypothetical protein
MKKILLLTILSFSFLIAQEFGAKLSDAKKTELSELVNFPSKFHQKTVKTEGVIDNVCQEKGCWMTLKADDKIVLIRFKDYAFFVPKNSAGKKVILEGAFIDLSQIKTKKKDCKGKHKDGYGKKEHKDYDEKKKKNAANYKIVASGVKIL